MRFGDADYLYYVVEVLTPLVEADSDNLALIEAYVENLLAGMGATTGEYPNSTISACSSSPPCLLLIRHKAEQKALAASLKKSLSPYGIDAFVAHEDIDVSVEWEHEIEYMPSKCHAPIYLASRLSNGSDWCQQEIGWAFGREIPVIGIALDENLGPFLGMRQAIRAGQQFSSRVLSKTASRCC